MQNKNKTHQKIVVHWMFLNWMIKDNIVIHYCELIFHFQIVLISFFVYLFEVQVISNLFCSARNILFLVKYVISIYIYIHQNHTSKI
jgi:hypothetical protein